MRLFLMLLFLFHNPGVMAFELIAHRGASGYLPEHTKEAAVLAYFQGANFIEQDLVVSKDNVLVVLHDIHLENVTNVESMFPERKRKDGRFYVVDFTLEELRKLSVHERTTSDGEKLFKNRYEGNGHFSIVTFEEQIELIAELNRQFNSNVGLFPELKAPEFHKSEGKDIAKLTIDLLDKYNLNEKDSNIYVQCFHGSTLIRIREEFKSSVRLVQLIGENNWSNSTMDFNEMRTAEGISRVSNYANGIGPRIQHVLSENGSPTPLVKFANAQNLIIYPYTFRTDATTYGLPPETLYRKLREIEIDGMFTDHIMTFMQP